MAIHFDTFSTRDEISNDNNSYNRHNFSHRHGFNIQSVKYFLLLINIFAFFPQLSRAETIGGVSASAAPIANSSGSVTNQAIQVLQGPYISNTYGNGVSCQGPTLNITPFVTGTNSWKEPYEASWDSPVYDMTTDEDGNLANPGSVIYYTPNRTGQKANNNISLGLSATISIPLDKRHHEGCLKAAATQTAYSEQLLANKRLDFEMARLKHCAEQKRLGVSFHPNSSSYAICADIIVTNPHGVIPQHQHSILPSEQEVLSSPDTDLKQPENALDVSESSQEVSESSSLQSLSEALSPSKSRQPAALLGLPMSLPQEQ
jgi:hypothetical protein